MVRSEIALGRPRLSTCHASLQRCKDLSLIHISLREVRNQGQETLTLSLDLYKQGLTPFQNVLDAQRSLLTYENQLVQARGNSLLQLIALYQALGGGWNN